MSQTTTRYYGACPEQSRGNACGKACILSSDFSPLSSSACGNPYAFTGRELDVLDGESLKIMYYRARAYDPQTGRFMQRDPLGTVD